MIDGANHSKQELIVGRALIVLFENQTSSEQNNNTTNEANGKGFASADGKAGTLSAKTFLKHGSLFEWQLRKWTKKNNRGISRIAKYHSQLNVAANAKAQGK